MNITANNVFWHINIYINITYGEKNIGRNKSDLCTCTTIYILFNEENLVGSKSS